MEELHLAGTGAEVPVGVLGVDPALHGAAPDRYVLLPHIQRQAGGNPKLLAHQIHPGDQLRDPVLHLDAGVHLHKVEILPVHQEFHRPGPLIAHGLRRPDGGFSHGPSQGGAEAGGGGLLHQLLVPPLDGAVPVTQVDGMPLAVRQNLHLHMPGVQHQLLQVHLVVSKAGRGLRLGFGAGGGELARAVTAADAPSPASGGGFQQHRPAHGLRRRQGLLHRGDGAVGAGSHRDPRRLHQIPGGGLGARLSDGVPGGADEGQPRFGAGVGEVRVLGEKAVARVYAVAAGGQGRRQQGVLIQIAVRRPGGADADGLRGQLNVEGLRVRLGIGGHRLDLQLPAGPEDPEGNLPPVGDKDPLQHGR